MALSLAYDFIAPYRYSSVQKNIRLSCVTRRLAVLTASSCYIYVTESSLSFITNGLPRKLAASRVISQIAFGCPSNQLPAALPYRPKLFSSS